MVYIYILFGHLFDNSIEMVYWLRDYNLRELGKLKVPSYLQSDWKIAQEQIETLDIYPLLYGVGGEIFFWRLFTQQAA